jgi:hypothetical protein
MLKPCPLMNFFYAAGTFTVIRKLACPLLHGKIFVGLYLVHSLVFIREQKELIST